MATMTTVEKMKTLLKATKNSDVRNILAKCTFDETQKIAIALGLNPEEIERQYWGELEIGLVSEILGTLDLRRSDKKRTRKWSKILVRKFGEEKAAEILKKIA